MNVVIHHMPSGVPFTVDQIYSDPKSRHHIIKTKEGSIYSLYGTLDLSSPHGTNDGLRRAYCRFAGVKFKDLQAAIKRVRERSEAAARAREVSRLESNAARLGYRLYKVSIKKATSK